jgi:hypothetical protein
MSQFRGELRSGWLEAIRSNGARRLILWAAGLMLSSGCSTPPAGERRSMSDARFI